MRSLSILLLASLLLWNFPGRTQSAVTTDSNIVHVPTGGNSWADHGAVISDSGLVKWTNPEAVCRTRVKLSREGKLRISLVLSADEGESRIKVSLGDASKELLVGRDREREYYAGEWDIKKAGYISIGISGISRTGSSFGRLSGLILGGSAVTPEISYVKDNKDNYFYWGRRGPSVHLNYDTRGTDSIEWFYTEITVPQKNDVEGSYFMADGFGEGYFGFQVNSGTERRVLFSVWSPYNTENPDSIPERYRIKLLEKGDGVYAGEFGNEGSGGQSYLRYSWKAGNTYRFLLHGKPEADSSTVYTAYFFAPEENKWMLIAGFKRPKTMTYLKHLHSFLENFEPETGETERMAYYGNQWVCDAGGKWHELAKVKFTGDMTARKNFRKDYAGGVEDGRFYLRNCGFFDEFTPLDHTFERSQGHHPPSTGNIMEVPPVKIGIFTDCQYCNCESNGNREYRLSLAKLDSCIAAFNAQPLDAVFHLGDMIDHDYGNLDSILPRFNRFKAPLNLVLGNHDYMIKKKYKEGLIDHIGIGQVRRRIDGGLTEDRRRIDAGCVPGSYTTVIGNWCFIILNGDDLSYFAPQSNNQKDERNDEVGNLYMHLHYNGMPWNGGIGKQQMKWLESCLKAAQLAGQKVIVCCHFPLFGKEDHLLFNGTEVFNLLSQYSSVKAYFNGHYHAGNYAEKDGIHMVNFKGMVDTKQNTFGVVTLTQDSIIIKGYGREVDRRLKIR